MSKYRANPAIEVKALRIVKSEKDAKTGEFTLTLEDGSEFKPDEGMTSRMTPAEGDYVVWQADGYVYLNPAAVFESKYLPITKDADVENTVKKHLAQSTWQAIQRMLEQVVQMADKIGLDITEEINAVLAKAPR